jgi:hypothetical protein
VFFYWSEVLSVGLLAGGLITGIALRRQRLELINTCQLWGVSAALLIWFLLLITGTMANQPLPWLLHGFIAHTFPPVLASVCGLWFGNALHSFRQRPLPFLCKSVAMLLLLLCAWSNVRTGKSGPTYVNPFLHEPTANRFIVFHMFAVPVLIGSVLVVWLLRLRYSSRPRREIDSSVKGETSPPVHL